MPYKDPEKRRAMGAKYQRKHRSAKDVEVAKAADRAYYAANKDKITERKKAWRSANRDKEARYRTKSRATVYGRAVMLLDNARQRAKKRGEKCEVTLDHVIAGVGRTFCPKTGVMFDLQKSAGHTNPFAPSVDRINSNKPYTNDNVQIVAWFYNHMKHEHSETFLLDLCARILDHAK